MADRPSSPPAPVTSPDVNRINASWLVRLRWGGILGQAAVIAYVHAGLGIALPLGALTAILVLELAANVAMDVWQQRGGPWTTAAVAAALAFDVTCFTALLYFTGGPFNPFSFLYLVYIALAALVLEPRWAWALVLYSAAASAGLFLRHVPLPMAHDHAGHAGHAMHAGHAGHAGHAMHAMPEGGEPLDLHLRGMWVAFAVAAAFIVYFLHRVTRALAEREGELARAREAAARSQRLAAMATLAAGAAHELSTPLSTIAVVAHELERTGRLESVAPDARLIREQVERCRDILGQLAGGAGVSHGEMATETTAGDIVRLALEGLADPARVTVEVGDSATARLRVPPRATAQALRNVLKNALDASPQGSAVALRVSHDAGGLAFEIEDRGEGMADEVLARAEEPFFTTKEPGRGMGLGLYLTRSVVEQLGGSLKLRSRRGEGTRVTVRVPTAATIDRIDPGPGA